MADRVADRLSGVHPKMLRASGEADRKPLADLRPAIGRVVERTLELAGMTKQEAAYEMGYQDQGTVSRWCSGLERPHMDKIFALESLRYPFIQALSEFAQADVEILVRMRQVG